jgi:hypothetical protein
MFMKSFPWDGQKVPQAEGRWVDLWWDTLAKVPTTPMDEAFKLQDQLNYKLMSSFPAGEELYKMSCWAIDSVLGVVW